MQEEACIADLKHLGRILIYVYALYQHARGIRFSHAKQQPSPLCNPTRASDATRRIHFAQQCAAKQDRRPARCDRSGSLAHKEREVFAILVSKGMRPEIPIAASPKCQPGPLNGVFQQASLALSLNRIGTSTPSASASSCEVPSASIPLLSAFSGDCPDPVDVSGAFEGVVTGAFSGVCSGSPKPGGSSDFGSSAPMAGIAEASAAHESAARSQALFAERINRDRLFVPCKWLLRYPVSQQHCTNNQQYRHQPLYQTSHFDFEYLVICRRLLCPNDSACV